MDYADAIMALGDDFDSLVSRAERNELAGSDIIKELRYKIEQYADESFED